MAGLAQNNTGDLIAIVKILLVLEGVRLSGSE